MNKSNNKKNTFATARRTMRIAFEMQPDLKKAYIDNIGAQLEAELEEGIPETAERILHLIFYT